MKRGRFVSVCTLIVSAVLIQTSARPALARPKDKGSFSYDVAIDIKTFNLNTSCEHQVEVQSVE